MLVKNSLEFFMIWRVWSLRLPSLQNSASDLNEVYALKANLGEDFEEALMDRRLSQLVLI